MTTIQVLIPDEINEEATRVAEAQHLSMGQLILVALTDKLNTVVKDPYLEARAQRGDRRKFEIAMASLPKVAPEDYDKL